MDGGAEPIEEAPPASGAEKSFWTLLMDDCEPKSLPIALLLLSGDAGVLSSRGGWKLATQSGAPVGAEYLDATLAGAVRSWGVAWLIGAAVAGLLGLISFPTDLERENADFIMVRS